MEIAIRKNKVWVWVGILSVLMACDSNRVFDQYQSLDNALWNKDSSLLFEFEITDTISRNNLYINLRNNNDYEFNNLFLITELAFPNGKKIVDTLQYQMADKEGRFLGSGLSEIKENKLFYKENSRFPKAGNYRLLIRQAMRKNGSVSGIKELKGVTDVGLRIEKIP